MSDTSTDAVERTRRRLILHGYSESAGLLRSLADSIEALEARVAAADKLADAVSRSTNKTASAVSPNARAALTAYQATKEQSDETA